MVVLVVVVPVGKWSGREAGGKTENVAKSTVSARGFLIRCQSYNIRGVHDSGGAQLDQRDGREPTPFF